MVSGIRRRLSQSAETWRALTRPQQFGTVAGLVVLAVGVTVGVLRLRSPANTAQTPFEAHIPPPTPAPALSVAEFAITTANSSPASIARGPDKQVWFTEMAGGKIGRVAADGTITEFHLPAHSGAPMEIVTGPDANLWFTQPSQIGRISPNGTITEFALPKTPAGAAGAWGIAAGPDGNLWFTEYYGNRIGRITPAGHITEFALPSANSAPSGIAAGPDGNLWFTEFYGNRIGRITPTGTITEFALPTPSGKIKASEPASITTVALHGTVEVDRE